MSAFAVPVVALDDVQSHPNADRLDVALVGGYRSVVPKGMFQAGEFAIYVPEGAVVPDWILASEGLTGKLAGSAKNRVKAIKLRGVLSQGIVLQLGRYPQCGTGGKPCVAAVLGITKHEAPIPVHMSGELKNLFGYPIAYDIENRKRYPNVLRDTDLVELTEKIHGTFCQIGWRRDLAPDPELFGDGRVFICSKGLGARGLVFKNNEANKDNLYVRTLHESGLIERMVEICQREELSQLYVLGEVFGAGVQDLDYGVPRGKPEFRAFDLFVEHPDHSCGYAGVDHRHFYLSDLGVSSVPIIAEGAWCNIKDHIEEYAGGATTLGGTHIREGVVIRLRVERQDPALGRVILKEVSEAYLLRKNPDATEFS